MSTKLLNEINFHRTNRNDKVVAAAKTEAREILMDLLQLNYLHPTYDAKRDAYFAAVQRYADLTDQTLEIALGKIF